MKKLLVLFALLFGMIGLQACSTEEPVVEDPIIEDPIDEEPVDEDPVDEEPVDEDPVDEEPVDEEPIDEEPIDEEPASPNIGEALALEAGEAITLSAVVTAISSHNTFYISDGTGSIAVFSSTHTGEVAVGDLIEISGERGAFRGLQQLTNVEVEILENNVDLPLELVALADADFDDLLPLQNRNLLIEGFTIDGITTDNFGNILFTLTLGENTINFRYDSRVAGGDAFEAMMEDIEDGDVVTITGAVLGWFDGPQVNFSPQIEITKE